MDILPVDHVMKARRERAFIILWFAMFVIAGGLGMVSPILPVVANDLGASGIWLALAFSGFALAMTPLTPLVGRWSDRWGQQRFILMGLSVYVLIGPGLALADNYQLIVLLRIAMGFGAACMFPSSLGAVAKLTPPGQEGRYMGLFMVSFTAGFGLGPAIGGVLTDTLGTHAAFLAMAAAAFIALLLATMLNLPTQDNSVAKNGSVPSLWVMFSNYRVQALYAFNFSIGIGFGSVLTFIAIFMNDSMHTSATIVGLVIGSRTVMSAIGQPIFGRLADRAPRYQLMVLGGLLLAAFTFVIPFAQTVGILFVVFLGLGLAEGIAIPSSLAVTTDLGRRYGHGTMMGFANAILTLGILSGSVGGSFVESVLGINNAFSASGVVMAVMIVVFLAKWAQSNRRPVPAQVP
jgi:DHA1 family multidrug resistance protein-like MFS transporter